MSLVLSGPGFISIVPDRKRRICNSKRKKRTFFNPTGVAFLMCEARSAIVWNITFGTEYNV